jgi:hypothetical protein
MMRLMGATQSDEDQMSRMAHPADRAYQVLQDLITANVFVLSNELREEFPED